MKKILFASRNFPYAVELLRKKLEGDFEINVLNPNKELEEQVKDVQVIIPAMTEINKTVIDAASKLELIAQWGVGLEGVDVVYARERGIKVSNVPGKNAASVAECSLFLMFCLAREINELRNSFENEKIGTPVGNELRDKNLFIVGTGMSGNKLARIADGIGMNCKGIKKSPQKGASEVIKEIGGPEDLHEFLPEADFVSLHVPLSDETRKLIGEEEFEKMKETAFIVNVSRGPIVVKEDLYSALVDGQIAGAGLDVFWREPPDPADKLYQLPNVVVTPHIAGVTKEAYWRIAERLERIIGETI